MWNKSCVFVAAISILSNAPAIAANTFSLNLKSKCGAYCRTSASPIIDHGFIYARAFDKFVYAIDQATGKIVKKYDTDYTISSLSTPAIQDGLLYVSAWYLLAFDQLTTKVKWKNIWAIENTPVIYNDLLFLGNRDGVTVVTRKTGKIKWKFESTYPDDPYFSSPLVHNGHVYAGSYSPNQSGSTGFYSFNAESGAVDWVIRSGYDYYATPCAINNTIFIGDRLNEFYAVNAETGYSEWEFTNPNSVMTSFVTSPYCDTDKVYVSSSGDNYATKFYAFDSKRGKIIWSFVPDSDGNITHSIEILSAPTVDNGVVFFGCDNHYLYALDKNTGALKWKFKADAEIRSQPTVANGTVYFTTLAGTLYAIDENSGVIF